MIRLSKHTALFLENMDFARDLDEQPYLHLYRHTQGAFSNSLLVQGDTSPNVSTTRENALAPFWNNVLLGTSDFYPEKALGLVNYQENTKIQELLSDEILPTIEYKKAILYFSQGSISDDNILGYALRLYCIGENGEEVSLLSMVDFKNDSQIEAKTPKYFESQIWNEGISVEFIDVEYLLNSNNPEIQEIKTLLFGQQRPDKVFVEYSTITEDSLDDFEENGYVFTSVNVNQVNEQQFPISFVGVGEEIYSEISLINDNRSIRSELKHRRFNVADFLETQKQTNEFYNITHTFLINCYDGDDELIQTFTHQISSPNDVYGDVVYRPVLDNNADHAKIDCSVRIENIQTGLVMSVASSIVITAENITGFKTVPDITFDNVVVEEVSNSVSRVVNKIEQTNNTPEIITMVKKVYIQTQDLEELVLLPSDFNAEIKLPDGVDITGNSELFLVIGTLKIKNITGKLLVFNIPKIAYNSEYGNIYTLLDSDGQVISTGAVIRKTYPTVYVKSVKDTKTQPTLSYLTPTSVFAKSNSLSASSKSGSFGFATSLK